MRSLIYPNLKTRAECLAEAARKFSLTVEDNYPGMFENLNGPAPEHRRETLLLSLADSVRIKFVDDMRVEAEKIVLKSALALSDRETVDACRKRMALMVPCEKTGSLMAILNAGWHAWREPQFFQDKEHNERRLDNLREVILKSIEVLEIETRLERAA